MKKTILRAAFLAALVASASSQAASIPQGTSYDSRVQTIMYNPDDVTRVRIALGTSTLIQLEEGETVEVPNGGLGIGDANAWTIGVRENNIFMKPKAESPDTNITLVTNRRTYALALETAPSRASTAFIVRYEYPEPPSVPKSEPQQACTNGPVNVDYQMWGDTGLAPHLAWDDGRFTCLRYPRGNDLPAVYRVAGDGQEVLTNMNVDGDTIVIHGVSEQFRLRLGNQVLGIKTDGLLRAAFNDTNTTVQGQVRELNDE